MLTLLLLCHLECVFFQELKLIYLLILFIKSNLYIYNFFTAWHNFVQVLIKGQVNNCYCIGKHIQDAPILWHVDKLKFFV